MSRAQVLPWAAAVTPLAVSLAANITWGATTGSPILIAAGVVTPLLLVLAIERWRVLPPADGLVWWVRTLAMSGVVLVVAGWSWLHATALLLTEVRALHPAPPEPGLDAVMRWAETALCVVAPLAVDGLAVLSVLTLGAVATRRETPGATGGAYVAGGGTEAGPGLTDDSEVVGGPPAPPASVPGQAPAGDDHPPAGEQAGDDRAADLIAAGAGRRLLARELGITEHDARRLLETRRNGAAA